jgi:hypothetical protein
VATQFVPVSLANHHSTTAPHRPSPRVRDILGHAAHCHSSVSGFAASHRAGELRSVPYLTGNTLRLRYSAQPINAVWGNSRCLL